MIPTSTVPHSGLFGIARTDVLRIQVNVPEASIRHHQGGTNGARDWFRKSRGACLRAWYRARRAHWTPSSRTLLTEVRVPNPDNALMPGMYAQVEFAGKQAKPLLARSRRHAHH